jgi:hypothetical protein
VHHSVVLELNVPSYRAEKRPKREENRTSSIQNPAPYRGHARAAYSITTMLPKKGRNNCRQKEFIIDVRHT